MAKYNYSKDALKGLGVGPFLGEVKLREQHIAEAPATPPVSIFNVNILANELHPHFQFGKVAKVAVDGDARTFTIVPDEAKGTKSLAYFRAGQYVSISLEIGGATVCKPYTICSGPRDALGKENTTYTLTIKHSKGGFASEFILGNWKEGTELTMSGPLGNFYYQDLRDAKHVIALAGGSGITPFHAMAAAIASGDEDFDLTILYGSRTADGILLKQELEEIVQRSGGKVKVVYVLSDEKAEGYEEGFLTAELIKKYAPAGEDYSIFVCGPKAMYNFEEKELTKLQLPKRRIRFEMSGEYGDPAQDPSYPAEKKGASFKVKVLIRGEEQEVTCRAEETLLHAMEQAGIHVPSDCRSGQCGWCHSRLIAGDVFVPEKADGRRLGDKKFGWIHPCATYPLSDVELEVFPIM